MLTVSPRHQILIGVALFVFMAATRSHHFASLLHLPDASWAVFFLAGIYVRPGWVFFAMLLEAALLDYAAISWGGVSSFCISPAYGFLVPAYGALWLAGRWYSRRHGWSWASLIPLGGSALTGAALCDILSGGGFYFFSGRFVETSLAEWGLRLLQYFPPFLIAMAFYLGVAAITHVVLVLATRGGVATRATQG